MAHPLLLALFADRSNAASAARDLRALGLGREDVSIVARSHDEEGALSKESGASPGSEIEDSSSASAVGELGAHLIAAIALVLPGVGPIVADGPLAAELGEAAGHLAGGIGRTLERAGLDHAAAQHWEARVHDGHVLVGAHVSPPLAESARKVFDAHGATDVTVGSWPD